MTALERFLGARRETETEEAGARFTLRLLSAAETLSAAREAAELIRAPEEAGLCRNAAVLARALYQNGERAFPDAAGVLDTLTGAQIARLAAAFAAFNGTENPSAGGGIGEAEALKKACGTRHMSA